jgi:hypothetical protein
MDEAVARLFDVLYGGAWVVMQGEAGGEGNLLYGRGDLEEAAAVMLARGKGGAWDMTSEAQAAALVQAWREEATTMMQLLDENADARLISSVVLGMKTWTAFAEALKANPEANEVPLVEGVAPRVQTVVEMLNKSSTSEQVVLDMDQVALVEALRALKALKAAAVKKKAEEQAAAAKKKAEEQAAAAATKKKAEEQAAATKKKAEEEEATAAAAKKKAEEEAAAAKKKAEEEAAAAAEEARKQQQAMAIQKDRIDSLRNLIEVKRKDPVDAKRMDVYLAELDKGVTMERLIEIEEDVKFMHAYVRLRRDAPAEKTNLDPMAVGDYVKATDLYQEGAACERGGGKMRAAKASYGPFANVFYQNHENADIAKALHVEWGKSQEGGSEGKNVVLFGYGPSGSGKTFTLFGKSQPPQPPQPGVVQTLLAPYGAAAQVVAVFEHYTMQAAAASSISTPQHRVLLLVDAIGLQAKLAAVDVSELGAVSLPPGGDVTATLAAVDAHRRAQGRIKETPFNKQSSRSHLYVVVRVQMPGDKRSKYVTIVDMAGQETPVAILNGLAEYIQEDSTHATLKALLAYKMATNPSAKTKASSSLDKVVKQKLDAVESTPKAVVTALRMSLASLANAGRAASTAGIIQTILLAKSLTDMPGLIQPALQIALDAFYPHSKSDARWTMLKTLLREANFIRFTLDDIATALKSRIATPGTSVSAQLLHAVRNLDPADPARFIAVFHIPVVGSATPGATVAATPCKDVETALAYAEEFRHM